MKAGSSSSSSASSDCPILAVLNRCGRRRTRLCRGGSESEDSEAEDDDGDESGAGRGERVGCSIAVDDCRGLGFGESERRFNVACAGRGLVCGAKFRDWTVVLADEVREKGGAVGMSIL
jgi:hypothetical protein